MKLEKALFINCLAALILLLMQSNAHALQSHIGIEGLYVHQGAHILFAVSMATFAWRVRSFAFLSPKARKNLFIGAVLLVVWNAWAFTGHIIELAIPKDHISYHPGAKVPSLTIHSWMDIFYYFFKMDHLWCLPAIFFIYLGISDISNTSTEW